MDKKLLDALNNLSFAFEELAKTLANASADKDKSATSTALTQTKLEKKLELIDKGVKKLQSDNQKILKNQEQLLKIAQSKRSETPVEQAAEPKKKSRIKDGLATIMMIAVGVLAIGMAFKLVGKINFLSVVGLSIAIVIVAIAFERVANLNLSIRKSVSTAAVMAIMSVGITAASWVLSLIRPISISQALTGVLIGAMFYFLLPAMASMIKAMETEEEVQFKAIRIKTKGLKIGTVLQAAVALPLIMIATSIGVTTSSWILSMIQPLSITQMVTAVAIGFLFTFLGSALAGIITAITTEESASGQGDGFGFAMSKKGISMQSAAAAVLIAPLIMIGMSIAIAGASYVLGLVKPVGIFKLFTAILIAAAFGAMGFGIGKVLEGFKKSGLNRQEAMKIAPLLPIVFIALAAAIVGTSWLFQKIKPVGLFKLITAALIGLVFIPLSYALIPLSKAIKGVTKKQALMMPVVMVLLALAVMLSSHLFKMTAFIKWSHLLNIAAQATILVALSFAFGLMMPMLSKIGPASLLKGALVIIGIAVIVMISSHILNAGVYDNYPSLLWILGVASTIAAFAFGALTIGGMVFGPQALVVLAGLAAILVISAAIVGTSYILASGNYDTYPKLAWSLMAFGTITAFALLASYIGVFAPFVIVGAFVIYGIAYAIVQVASLLATGKYDVYPTLQWSVASLGAITAFASLAASLSLAGIFAMIGIPFMMQIAQTIVDVSKTLSKGEYNTPGLFDWTLSTVLLYTTFVPILGVLAVVSLASSVAQFFGSDPFGSARKMLVQIAETIVEVSHTLAGGNYKSGPTKEWANSVSLAMGAFAPIYGMLVRNNIMELLGGGGIGPEDFNNAIRTIIGGIKWAAQALSGFEQYSYPSEAWAKGVGTAIGAFAPVYEILSKSKGWFTSGPTPEEYKKAIWTVSQGIIDAAEFFSQSTTRGVFDLNGVPSKRWGERVGAAISAFTPALEFITKNASWWEGADPTIIKKAIRSTTEAIVESSHTLKGGDFTTVIPSDWAKGVGASVKSYSEILKETPSFFDTFDFDYFISSMVNTSKTFSKIAMYLNNVQSNVMSKVFDNVVMYAELAKWLTTNDADPTTVNSAVSSMFQMALGYSALGRAIKKLNSDLEELDIEKLNALKSLNASVILISLMDPKNFKEMMEELEDKGGVLIDALNDLESKEGEEKGKKKGKGAPSPTVKTGDKKGDSQKTMTDLYTIMESANQKLELIARTSDKMSKYVDEIRGDDPMIRRK